MTLKEILRRSGFFIGWTLSPFTSWNDVFINIPISYMLASLFIRRIDVNFINLVLVFYWLTNIVGIVLMCLSGKNMFTGGKSIISESLKLLLTIVSYSIILALLGKVGLLKPISFGMVKGG